MTTRQARKEPWMLMRDNDVHWYLLPEREASRFEALLELASGDDISPAVERELAQYTRYAIDGPHLLRIYEWETQ